MHEPLPPADGPPSDSRPPSDTETTSSPAGAAAYNRDPTTDQLRRTLVELSQEQPKAAHITELFLDGRSFDEIAILIGESEDQVLRQFQFARAWVRLHAGSHRDLD